MTTTTTTPTPCLDVLDFRDIAPRERHLLIFARFDALALGDSLELVNDHDPKPLFHQFVDRVSGQFGWNVLAAGPAVWRVRITRVAPAPRRDAPGGNDRCCSGGACCG